MPRVKKEDLNGNYTPTQSILYAIQKVEDNDLNLDFWGRAFLKTMSYIGLLIIVFGGLVFLTLLAAIIGKLYGH